MRYLQQFLLIILFLAAQLIHAQIVDDVYKRPAYSYQSKENPYYWKNKKPFEGYWQQDVYYSIKATIDEKTDIISGKVILTYYNNSPDKLSYVYFHLYQEAFQPNSYVDALNRVNDVKPEYGKYERAGHGTDVEKVSITKINGKPVNKETVITQDFTVMKVDLPDALEPASNITFEIPFSTYFDSGSLRRRMKEFKSGDFMHYDGVHWYPRICVYDRKFGWDTDQHLGKEFYGDYGTYEVELNFASNYIVEATGILENENEVLPKSVRQQLDIKNFTGKPWEEKASEIIPYKEGERKVWKYFAMNVHDFAFTADPNYRIGEASAVVNGRLVRCIAIAQEGHAGFWQNAAEYTSHIIETYSRDFGDYIWPKIVVADARDGMEYPMLTLDGGYDPGYRDLIAHEVGHMWYFGMVGNNETYRAALDEGFTQFLTAWGYRHVDGDIRLEMPDKNKYVAKYREPDEIIMSEVYNGYLGDAVRENDRTLNTHSDMFNSALNHGGGYRHVYFKTAVMLYNLQYVLGDDLFQSAMKHYTEQWRLCHPYFEDFRNSIINYTHVDLNWFFDQWMETTKNIDYGIENVKKLKDTDLDGQPLKNYSITFKRKGQMQMPLDFIAILEGGDTLRYYIPNTWFNKNEIQGAGGARINRLYYENVISLPKWYGWDKLNQEYTATITTTKPVVDIIIDPSNRLADINKMDNSWKCNAEWKFDAQISNPPDWKHYEFKWRPDLWWNEYDGIKAGAHFTGGYYHYKHQFDFTAWANTGIAQGILYNSVFLQKNDDGTITDRSDEFNKFNFNLHYNTSFDKLMPNTNFLLDTKMLDGVFGFKTGIEKKLGRGLSNTLSIYVKDLDFVNNQYLYNSELIPEAKDNSVNIDFIHHYGYFSGNGQITIAFRSNDLFSDYDFSRCSVEAINKTKLGKFDLHTRFFMQAGSGSNVPFASALFLAGGNTEDMLDNKYTRSRGVFPDNWVAFTETTGHFQEGGGLNLRGYAGYLAPETDEDETQFLAYYGVSGASINAELQFNRFFQLKAKKFLKIEPYIFSDAGILSVDENLDQLSSLRADAGLGTAVYWNYFGPLETIKPVCVRIDFPLLLNHPPYAENAYFKFRYVVGIERAF